MYLSLSKNKAFTLLELLTAAALSGMILLGVYRTLSSGIGMYAWLIDNRPEMETAVAYERMAGDLRNISMLSQSSFLGRSERMSFFLRNDPLEDDTDRGAIVRVEYVFTGSGLVRKTYDLGASAPNTSRKLIGGIERGSFAYGAEDDFRGGDIRFLEACDRMPAAVRIRFFIGVENEEILNVIGLPVKSMVH